MKAKNHVDTVSNPLEFWQSSDILEQGWTTETEFWKKWRAEQVPVMFATFEFRIFCSSILYLKRKDYN
jgi:hypothetical protein